MGKALALVIQSPDELRPAIIQSAVIAPNIKRPVPDEIDLEGLRRSIRSGEKLRIRYTDLKGHQSDRVIWPVTLAYFETVRLLVAWCELRGEFRYFRTDKIVELAFLGTRMPITTAELRRRWNDQRSDACT